MPDRQEMEFIINSDGTVEERVSGVPGAKCESLTESLEKALGDVVQREHTPDYYRAAQEPDDVSLQAKP